jgi:hypothetical protein
MHLLVILQPTIESSLRWLFIVITFLSKFLNQITFKPEILFPSNVESFSLKNLGDLPFDRVIPMLYLDHAFLLDPLKFDGIASSHFCIAPYHMHHLTSACITLSKSVSI